MRRRDFTIGVLLAGAVPAVQAQVPAKQHRIAIVIPAGPAARINDAASRYCQAFWEELRRLSDAEGQNLIVEGYSGEGRPAGYADLAREVTGRNPDVIVAVTGGVAQAFRAATDTIPIVWIGSTRLAVAS
jgi:putative ABC transport system substrate-binding protein